MAVCQQLNMRLTPAGLDARIMGGILEACGSTIANRTTEKEMATALEKISNKGIIGAAGIPGSDKGFRDFHDEEARRFKKNEGRK